MTTTLPTVEDWRRDYLMETAERIAADLEQVAAYIRSRSKDFAVIGTPGNATYSSTASAIIHKVTWAIPNMSLDRLTSAATEADIDRELTKQAAKLAAGS